MSQSYLLDIEEVVALLGIDPVSFEHWKACNVAVERRMFVQELVSPQEKIDRIEQSGSP
ncbi:hypothetical protein ACFFK0_26255 [Paenibacillus chartarius]|uniref:Uncharacterized protein n=1 Tax=Paenibacillus chartarius TaxID=747481 RepID=A0ABV6DTD1_9BACL